MRSRSSRRTPVGQQARYTIAVARAGELLAVSALDAQLAIHAIARLGYVCQVDPAATRMTTGRTRVRSVDAQRDLIVTIAPGLHPRAELMFVAPGAKHAMREPPPGERIGHYQILCRIGAGGMGDVYEVEHVTLRTRAALKILQHEVIERDAASRDKFLLEAQATARIRNPHIVEVFDFGYLADGRPYFVMELLAAQSLGDILERGALPVATAVAVARQIAAGLCAAHEHGIVHADVTPSNVLVQRDHVKLIDFGLAAAPRSQRPLAARRSADRHAELRLARAAAGPRGDRSVRSIRARLRAVRDDRRLAAVRRRLDRRRLPRPRAQAAAARDQRARRGLARARRGDRALPREGSGAALLVDGRAR